MAFLFIVSIYFFLFLQMKRQKREVNSWLICKNTASTNLSTTNKTTTTTTISKTASTKITTTTTTTTADINWCEWATTLGELLDSYETLNYFLLFFKSLKNSIHFWLVTNIFSVFFFQRYSRLVDFAADLFGRGHSDFHHLSGRLLLPPSSKTQKKVTII